MGIPPMEFLAGKQRGLCSTGLAQGHFLGGGGEVLEPELEAAEGKSLFKRGVGSRGCPRSAEGGLASLTRPLSPEQPAIHDLAFQAGGVCLQPVPEQREPQPGGSCHPHHHEPESYRSVASGSMCHVTRGRS